MLRTSEITHPRYKLITHDALLRQNGKAGHGAESVVHHG